MFDLQHSPYNLLEFDGKALENAWMTWVHVEVKKRYTILPIYARDERLMNN